MSKFVRLIMCVIVSGLVAGIPAFADRGPAAEPVAGTSSDTVKAGAGGGIAFDVGDVLAAIGNGQVKHYSPDGTLIQTLDSTTGSTYNAGMCFDDDGNLYSTNFSAGNITKFDPTGTLVAASWATGFSTQPESCVFDGTSIFSGEVDGDSDVRQWDLSGTQVDVFDVPVGPRGTDWIDLAEDNCTLFYTSEGSNIRRYDICTDTALSDFASGLTGPCYAFRIRPLDGGDFDVLVTCTSQTYRLDSSGSTIQTYSGASLTPPASLLFAMNLDPDGTSFWTGDLNTGDTYRIDIDTGNQMTHFNTSPNTAMGGLAVVGEITAGVPTPTPTGTAGTPTPTPPPGAEPIPTGTGIGFAVFVGLLALAAFVLLIRKRH